MQGSNKGCESLRKGERYQQIIENSFWFFVSKAIITNNLIKTQGIILITERLIKKEGENINIFYQWVSMINASSFQTCNRSLILEKHSEIIASKISLKG